MWEKKQGARSRRNEMISFDFIVLELRVKKAPSL
jgi:hypothetical protein